jgi:hypothetical protein
MLIQADLIKFESTLHMRDILSSVTRYTWLVVSHPKQPPSLTTSKWKTVM